MPDWVIRHESQEDRYWSLYGWAPLTHAMRFMADDDAKQFRDRNGLHGALVQSVTIDDAPRPDIQTDYNPFAL